MTNVSLQFSIHLAHICRFLLYYVQHIQEFSRKTLSVLVVAPDSARHNRKTGVQLVRMDSAHSDNVAWSDEHRKTNELLFPSDGIPRLNKTILFCTRMLLMEAVVNQEQDGELRGVGFASRTSKHVGKLEFLPLKCLGSENFLDYSY